MNLSPSFTLEALTRSATASRKGIDNSAPQPVIHNLRLLCLEALERIEALTGKPIYVTSGYRCSTLNREIGGSVSSQHCRGEAADIECHGWDNLELAATIAGSTIPFDQLILEFYVPGVPSSGWVHVSHAASGKQRRQVLHIARQGGSSVTKAGLPS